MPSEIRERLKEFIDLANSMLRNPIDAGPVTSADGFRFISDLGDRQPFDALRDNIGRDVGGNWKRLHDVIADWEGLDLVVYQHGFDISPLPVDEYAVAGSAGVMVLAAMECKMPKAIVLHSVYTDSTWRVTAELRAMCADLRLPIFFSMRSAALATRRLLDFHSEHPGWSPTMPPLTSVKPRKTDPGNGNNQNWSWRGPNA